MEAEDVLGELLNVEAELQQVQGIITNTQAASIPSKSSFSHLRPGIRGILASIESQKALRYLTLEFLYRQAVKRISNSRI